NNTPPDTEGRTYQLLGLAWAGTDRVTLNKSARALLAMQNKDGGWPSLDGRDSEAYSTGQALVALNDAGGIAITNASWQRGIDFLLKNQAAAGGGVNVDGTWHVESRLYPPAPVSPPYFESGFPYGHDQFISASGTAWAVMALARALGPAQKIAA